MSFFLFLCKKHFSMNKLSFITIGVITLACSSCVPKNKYELLEYQKELVEEQVKSLQEDNQTLVEKYNTLVDKYNSLLDDYNDAQFSYEVQNSKSSQQEDIIDRAKDAVNKLKRDFSSFQNGWCDAYDIERDIRSIEDKLDGWL